MRILIHGLNYAPEAVGVGKYTGEMAEWLAARGHAVEVLTAPPHYPEWRVPEVWRGLRWRRETRNGVDVLRSPLWLPRRLTPLWRICCCLLFATASFVPLFNALRRRPDVLIVIEPSFFSLPPAWLLGHLLRVPVWLHIQDFELAAAQGLGYVESGLAVRMVEAIEGAFLRSLHRVSTLTPQMQQRLVDLRVPAQRRVLFPNWVDCEMIRPLERPGVMREAMGIGASDIVLLYSGSFGRKHGLELLVDAARALRGHAHLRFVLCGDGAEKSALQAAAADLPNLLFLPLQPLEKLNELLNLADIHLLPQRASVADAVLPSKLTGMLASGRPVIATAEPGTELARIVADTGIVVPTEDLAAFNAAVLALASDTARRHALGVAARRYAEQTLDKQPILRAFENALQRSLSA